MRGAAEHTAATSRPYGRSTSEQIWKLFSTSLQLACPWGLWPLAHRRRSNLRTGPYADRFGAFVSPAQRNLGAAARFQEGAVTPPR